MEQTIFEGVSFIGEGFLKDLFKKKHKQELVKPAKSENHNENKPVEVTITEFNDIVKKIKDVATKSKLFVEKAAKKYNFQNYVTIYSNFPQVKVGDVIKNNSDNMPSFNIYWPNLEDQFYDNEEEILDFLDEISNYIYDRMDENGLTNGYKDSNYYAWYSNFAHFYFTLEVAAKKSDYLKVIEG